MSIARKLRRKDEYHVGKFAFPNGNREERRGYFRNVSRPIKGKSACTKNRSGFIWQSDC